MAETMVEGVEYVFGSGKVKQREAVVAGGASPNSEVESDKGVR